MLQTLKDIFSVKDIKKKILNIIFIIFIFRVGTFITIPGINKIDFMNDFQDAASGILGTINIISGGAFSRLSIMAMTIGPYITASIILNLLQIVVPSLEKLAKEGETGKKQLAKYTKYLTVAFALVEGVGLYLKYRKYLVPQLLSGPGVIVGILLFLTSLMAGTALLMWLGDKITETGLGNGISMIIFVGIVSRIPAAVTSLVNFATSTTRILILIGFLIAMVLLVAGVIFVQQAERRIPVNYAKRVVGRRMMGGQNTHIPLKLAMAGVIPVIFAMSFMMFPASIIQLVSKGTPTGFWGGVYKLFAMQTGNIWGVIAYALIYMILIVGFTYFYTTIIVNPIEMANNLKKNGGFIPGIRAGKQTCDYITNVLSNITLSGGLFLALVAVLPILVQGLMPSLNVSFGGTSILIVVSVALEILKQIESQMVSKHYKGFLE